MAWLQAIPKAEQKLAEADKRSRLKRMEEDGFLPNLPPLPNPHLSRVFFEVGPAVSFGMGQSLLSHLELSAFQANTGIELDAWEVRTLRRLSAEWIAESQRAEKTDCPPPYDEMTEERRRDVAKHIKNLFRG